MGCAASPSSVTLPFDQFVTGGRSCSTQFRSAADVIEHLPHARVAALEHLGELVRPAAVFLARA